MSIPNRRRAMTSSHAREVKVYGHVNEHHFAELIGGAVNKGTQTDKKDVVDKQHRFHSVKGGKWWQIFLYSRERFVSNTIFQGIGNVANIMIDCLDAYPPTYQDYKENKLQAKENLKDPMRKLLAELKQENIYRAFLQKALFDGGNADYLSIYPGMSKEAIQTKEFHVFFNTDVIDAFSRCVYLVNSKARNKNQQDAQKVIFKSRIHNKNIGEIEDRHDSSVHYRQMKFRLNGKMTFQILRSKIKGHTRLNSQLNVYGRAQKLFSID